MGISGIITTNLGKTATLTKVAGRERRVHHSKSLPLLLTGERFFFGSDNDRIDLPELAEKTPEIHIDIPISNDTVKTRRALAFGSRAGFGNPTVRNAGAGQAAEEQR
jgi:hypothetical protein